MAILWEDYVALHPELFANDVDDDPAETVRAQTEALKDMVDDDVVSDPHRDPYEPEYVPSVFDDMPYWILPYNDPFVEQRDNQRIRNFQRKRKNLDHA